MSDAGAAYHDLLERARRDPRVVGVVAFGSRAVGSELHAGSDVDCFVIVDGPTEAARTWRTPHGSAVEVWAMTLDDFRLHGLHGTETWWNRPSLIRARVDLDKLEGTIGALVESKRRLTPQEASSLVDAALDDAINSIYRALKTVERGRELAARLDAIEAVPRILTAAFALEGRVRPWNKWLEYELTVEPLRIPAFADLADVVADLAANSTAERLHNAFRLLEGAARATGLGRVFDGWAPDVEWLRGEGPYRPTEPSEAAG